MSFQFSLFQEKPEEKTFFFFTVLHYPKELMSYCRKSELPEHIGAYIVVESEESAVRELMRHGIKNPMPYINFAKENSGKWLSFFEYKELLIF